jgi:putative ABC transport system substrate-binding protein
MARDRGTNSISRRSFCWTLAGVLVAPSSAIAQASKVRRIGILFPGPMAAPEDIRRANEPLRQMGWVEGQNLYVERRYVNLDELQRAAEELVRAHVELIVTAGTPATLAAKRATTTIPIFFQTASDPVLRGLVASLARPGGNVTGYSETSPEVTAKSLSVLRDLLPQLRRVGMVVDAGNPANLPLNQKFEQVCKSLGLMPIIVEIGAADAADGVIAQLVRQHAEALVVQAGFLEIFDAATRRGLPTMSDDSEWVRRSGALIAYGATLDEQFRRRAEYIDRILRGAKPADLPVQQPTKFELAINLKTAKALGLTIPKELLLRADEVIQ